MNNIDLNRKPLMLALNKKVGFFHPYYKLEMGLRITFRIILEIYPFY